MGSFFRNMNLARLIILLSIPGAIVLAYMGAEDQQRLTSMERALESEIPTLVGDISALSQNHSLLTKSAKKEGFKRNQSPEVYVRSIAERDDIEIGQVTLTPRNERVTATIEDQVYKIKPTDKERKRRRDRIAFFLYELETSSRRVKITDIKVELANKRGVGPADIPEDEWTFECEITTRQASEKSR